MPTFLMAYRSPTGYQPSDDSYPQWRAWFDGMGDQLVDLGKPVAATAQLGNCSPGNTQLGGYSLVEADDLDAALAVAKGCPHLERDGGVEVGLLRDVRPPS